MYLNIEVKTFYHISGFIWNEIKQLWDVGLKEYLNDMWNVVDFTTNSLYVATVSLRLVAYYRVQVKKDITLFNICKIVIICWFTKNANDILIS